MRVYELARDLGLESKDVLARVHELGIEAKTASSGIGDDDAALVRLSYDEEKAPAALALRARRRPESRWSSSPEVPAERWSRKRRKRRPQGQGEGSRFTGAVPSPRSLSRGGP
jgi:hypothetical protein